MIEGRTSDIELVSEFFLDVIRNTCVSSERHFKNSACYFIVNSFAFVAFPGMRLKFRHTFIQGFRIGHVFFVPSWDWVTFLGNKASYGVISSTLRRAAPFIFKPKGLLLVYKVVSSPLSLIRPNAVRFLSCVF